MDAPTRRELGRIVSPYGGVPHCANSECPHEDTTATLDEFGAYLYRDLESDKLAVFCGDCARYAELEAPERFKVIAL